MKDEKESGPRTELPESAVIYRPEGETFQKLWLCEYMRELLDNPPFDPGLPEPDPHEKK